MLGLRRVLHGTPCYPRGTVPSEPAAP
jgi:hypothetical protein